MVHMLESGLNIVHMDLDVRTLKPLQPFAHQVWAGGAHFAAQSTDGKCLGKVLQRDGRNLW